MTTPAIEEAARLRAEASLIESLSMENLRKEMREAVSEGIKSAMTPEAAQAFWGVGLDMLQKQATNQAGLFVLSGVKSALKGAMWAGLFLVCVWMLGGWKFVVLAWHALFTARS